MVLNKEIEKVNLFRCDYCGELLEYLSKKIKLLKHLETTLPEGKVLNVCKICCDNLVASKDTEEFK